MGSLNESMLDPPPATTRAYDGWRWIEWGVPYHRLRGAYPLPSTGTSATVDSQGSMNKTDGMAGRGRIKSFYETREKQSRPNPAQWLAFAGIAAFGTAVSIACALMARVTTPGNNMPLWWLWFLTAVLSAATAIRCVRRAMRDRRRLGLSE